MSTKYIAVKKKINPEIIFEEKDFNNILCYLANCNDASPFMYVVNNKQEYLGCISLREIKQIKETGNLVYNADSKHVHQGNQELEDANNIFSTYKNILRIPVLDENNRIVYEYHSSGFELQDFLSENGVDSLKPPARKKRIIVSIATYGDRIFYVEKAIMSILTQSMRPDLILLYLDENFSYDIPESLLKLEPYGLRIIKNVKDLKPHKKYFYSLQEYPEDIIITLDDDSIYETDLLERLYNAYLQYPDCIICGGGHRLMVNENGKCIYEKSDDTNLNQRAHDILAIGVCGVLYPPHLLKEKAFDSETFMKIAAYNDDLWLKFCELYYDIKVYCINETPQYPREIPEAHKQNAWSINCLYRNDIITMLLEKHFDIYLKDYCNTFSDR